MPVYPRLKRTLETKTSIPEAEQKTPHPRSIDAFCKRNGLCRATFYNQAKLGLMPDVLRIGARVTITEESETEWKRRLSAPMNAAA